MLNLKKNYFKKGIGLVEIVIGSAIVLAVVLAVVQTYNIYVNFTLANENNTRASFLLQEGVETIIYLRDVSWTSNISPLINGTTYYLYFDGSTWLSTTTPQYTDTFFVRSFVTSAVNRDSDDDIALVGTNDPNTIKVDVSVEYWQGHSTTTKSISTYITNLYAN